LERYTMPLELAQIQDALNRLGRPVIALDKILAIVHEELPAALTGLGFPDRCLPRGYHYAGEVDIEKEGWPKIIVGGSFIATEFGMGHMDENELGITVGYAPNITRREFQESLDIATVVRGILYVPTYRANVRDAEDPTVLYWQTIQPTGYTMVPRDFRFYAGWTARFVLRQTPGSNLWTSLSLPS